MMTKKKKSKKKIWKESKLIVFLIVNPKILLYYHPKQTRSKNHPQTTMGRKETRRKQKEMNRKRDS